VVFEYRMLGPLELRRSDRVLPLGGRRQQTLLAVLLLNAGRTVPFDQLVANLWDDPPRSARRQVVNAAATVRRVVEQGGGGPLVTTGHGYRLETAGDRLDIDEFRALKEAGEHCAATGRPAEAMEQLQRALDLWRGPVLAGLASDSIDITRQRLAEQRLDAIERLAGLRLDIGEVTSSIGWLVGLVAEHPARESLRAMLMRALHQAGRPADALAVFAEGRALLAEEFGVGPGPELRLLHEEILQADLALDRIPRARVAEAAPTRGSCFLPSGPPDFAGRHADLRLLTSVPTNGAAGATPVVCVEGMGGVGKTALAVHAAHQLIEVYPDGQYFVDLRGFSEHEFPMPAGKALEVLLRQSGIAPEQLPVGTDARRDLWRARVAGRRVLVVLDNAADALQLRALMPASAGSLVLVTSRRQLPALEGAVPVPLDVLPDAEAMSLFRRIAGPDRVDPDPQAIRRIGALTGGLPLAIRIAASRFRRRPAWTLAHLARLLRDVHGLTAGDRSVAGVIILSYRHLSPSSQRLFRLLGTSSVGPAFDAHAAAALTRTPLAVVRQDLEELLEYNLLVQDRIDRYRLHDLVRGCARRLATEARPEGDLRPAAYQPLG
jgi:DNA-binding SARP family transcriptional activator